MGFKCRFPDCKNSSKHIKMHRFPISDKQICNMWLERIRNPKLLSMNPKQLYHNYRVCHAHFSDISDMPALQRGLKPRFLPNLYLPGFKEEANEGNSISPYESSNVRNVMADCNSAPSTYECPSESFVPPNTSMPFQEETINISKPPKSRKDWQCQFNLLKSVGVTRQVQLKPKARKLYSIIQNLQKINCV